MVSPACLPTSIILARSCTADLADEIRSLKLRVGISDSAASQTRVQWVDRVVEGLQVLEEADDEDEDRDTDTDDSSSDVSSESSDGCHEGVTTPPTPTDDQHTLSSPESAIHTDVDGIRDSDPYAGVFEFDEDLSQLGLMRYPTMPPVHAGKSGVSVISVIEVVVEEVAEESFPPSITAPWQTAATQS